jgi:hypothetical protein
MFWLYKIEKEKRNEISKVKGAFLSALRDMSIHKTEETPKNFSLDNNGVIIISGRHN